MRVIKSFKSLASGAFRETKLTSCVIPAGITSLSQQLFYACSNLKTVTLPEGVVGIEAWALVSTGLTELHLPASLTDIAGGSLGKNTSLSTITVAPGNPAYKAENGLLISLADSYIIAAAVQQGVSRHFQWSERYRRKLFRITAPTDKARTTEYSAVDRRLGVQRMC